MVLTLIVGLPDFPLRVVTRTTPFAPRTPNTAVAEASFRIERFSISFGSICENSRSTPSTRIRGDEAPPDSEPLPRTKIEAASSPGCPLVCTVETPGIAPANTLLILATGALSSSFVSIDDKAPVNVAFVCVP